MTLSRRAVLAAPPAILAVTAVGPRVFAAPPTTTTFGASRPANVPGYPTVEVSRVYLGPGDTPTNYAQRSNLRDAVATSTQAIWLSAKDPNPQNWLGALLDSFASTGLTIWYTQHHEPEGDYSNASTYQREWRRAAPICNSRSWVQCGPCLTGWHAAGISENFVPDVPHDFTGFDKYNPGIGSPARYVNPATVYAEVFAFASQTGKPLRIGETGTGLVAGDGGAGRRAWMRAARQTLIDFGADSALWWNAKQVAFMNEADAEAWLEG